MAGREWIGVTAGASAPEALVAEVVEKLRTWGAERVQESRGNRETVTFSLPRALKSPVGAG